MTKVKASVRRQKRLSSATSSGVSGTMRSTSAIRRPSSSRIVGSPGRIPSICAFMLFSFLSFRQGIEAFKDELGRAGHPDIFALPPPDEQLTAPAGDDHRLARFRVTMREGRHRRCAGARAAAPGLARAPLPDAHVYSGEAARSEEHTSEL